MRRAFSVFIAAILLLAAFPGHAVGEAEQSHTVEADQVLIYNPLPYGAKDSVLFTGTIALPEETEPEKGEALFSPGMHKTGRDLTHTSKDPRSQDFWVCTDLMTYRYDKRTFRLAAEGEHCYIWAMEDDATGFTDAQAALMLEQFETLIYPSDTERFGAFRDLAGDGKLHIVTYTMNSSSVCGFFDSYDLYTKEEIAVIDPDDPDSYNCLPIININARMANREAIVYGTLAHEFQHLILRSAVLASPANEGLLGGEKTVGTWLNEGFSMAAEEFCYPGSVAEQGYVDAFERSDKVRLGMSYQNFDASATDVGAYGQSFLFTEYLKAQCGDTVFSNVLTYWKSAAQPDRLTEAQAISAELSEEQTDALHALCAYPDALKTRIGSDSEVLLSEFALAFRLAMVLKAEDGMFSIGASDPHLPEYVGSGRRIEGGGALLLESGGSFTVPADADSGLIFVGIKDGAINEVYAVPEPDPGFYVIAANFDGAWYALPAAPHGEGTIKPVTVKPDADGTVAGTGVSALVFEAERTEDGFVFRCEDENGVYYLGRGGSTKQTLSVAEAGNAFSWTRFADGSDRLQADGFYGRAILYGSYQGGFGYFPSGYFENASFAKPVLLKVRIINGDANLDGKVTAADAALVLRTVVGLSYMNAAMRAAGDYDGDGTISAADAAKILRFVIHADS